MRRTKSVLLIFIVNLKSFIECASVAQQIDMKNCSSSGKSILVHQCEITVDQVLNFDISMMKPVAKFIVQIKFARIVGQKSTEMFKSPPVEWCSLVGGKAKANRLVKTFIDQFRDKLPKATQKCPIDGRISFTNFPIRNKMFNMFPAGTYKITVAVSGDDDNFVLYVEIVLNI